MLAGLIIASFQFILDQNKANFSDDSFLFELAHIPAIYLFPIIFIFSLLGSFIGTFLTKPTDMKTLKSFYFNVKPWGWWKPVYLELKSEDQKFEKNNEFIMDMFNCFIGILWQSSMILMPIYLIFRDYEKTGIALLAFIISSFILKFTWLDRVRKIPN